MKYVPPSTTETAFNCPHCGALTTQTWFDAYLKHKSGQLHRPALIHAENLPDFSEVKDKARREMLIEWSSKMAAKAPFYDPLDDAVYTKLELWNVNIAECFNCNQLSVWIYDKILYPVTGSAPEANPDMSADIQNDYNEASAILDLSPRGAAALIRLAIQKLCVELDQPGKNLNEDIGALVKNGLSIKVQQALDAVRVIGNNAVHPGQIATDDRATALTLFGLLNLIVEKTISEPKHVETVYGTLPEGARAAIARRDAAKASEEGAA